jgi:uncharacterized membrane protein
MSTCIRPSICLLLPAAAALIAPPLAWPDPPASFRALGRLPGAGLAASAGTAISPDGATVVGHWWNDVGLFAHVWSQSDGLRRLELPPFPSIQLSLVHDVNDQATHAAGRIFTGTAGQPSAYIWRNLEPTGLPGLRPDWVGLAEAHAVSADGRIVYGNDGLPEGIMAVRWIDGVPQNMRFIPGDSQPILLETCSDDGQVAAGFGEDPRGWGPVIVRDGVATSLGGLYGMFGDGLVQSLSSNGRRAVGKTPGRIGNEGFIWSDPTGMVGLGELPGGAIGSTANAVSGEGRLVGGQSFSGTTPYQRDGFLWDPRQGIRSLNAVLDHFGVDRQGWFIIEVLGISRDGTAMTGTARQPDGRLEAFYVTLPPWCWSDCDGDGVSDFNDLLCFLNRYNRAQADPRQNPLDFFYADLHQDDAVDFQDFLEFLRRYNAGC